MIVIPAIGGSNAPKWRVMMNHHTILLTAGVLLATLGTCVPAMAQVKRIDSPSRVTITKVKIPGGGKEEKKQATPAEESAGDSSSQGDPAGQAEAEGTSTEGASPSGASAGAQAQPASRVIRPSSSAKRRITKVTDSGQTGAAAATDGVAVKLSGASGASGSGAKPLNEGDSAVVPALEITIQDGKVLMRDIDTDRILVDSGATPFWSKYGDGNFKKKGNWAVPTITFKEHSDGFDVVYDFTNTSSSPAMLGELFVPGIVMPETINTRRTFLDSSEYQVTRPSGNSHWVDRAYNYPSQSYAPVMIFGDEDYTIGVSLMYPILDYEHSVHMRFMSPKTPSGEIDKWAAAYQIMMGYGLNPFFPDERSYIQPGESRQYTIAVRVVKNIEGDHPNRWLQTLLPYRDYFRSLYGGVHYERDPRPIVLLSMANREQNSDQANNPRSYNYNSSRAPDKFGFGPWAQYMRSLMDKGIYRFNLVGVSGAQWSEGSLNNPFLVATPFFNEPAMAMAKQSVDQLQALSSDGAEIGFWWGRSSTVAFGWDTGVNEYLDPNNPVHMSAAHAELEAATQMGASTFGMDDFKKMRTWDAYRYINTLKQDYPNIKMVIEPMPADVLHSLAPGLIFMNRPEGQENFAAEQPHALADFLLPGHEIWGTIRSTPFYQSGQAKKGSGVPDWALKVVAERSAKNGYSPVIFGEPNITGWDINAKEAWLVSVPVDLQD